jgi:choline kinase
MTADPFDVIVLAAGQGLRLGDIGDGRAKALLELGGRSLVARAIDFASALGATRIVVVTGKDPEAVAAAARATGKPALAIVDNPRFRAGNLLSLRAALPEVSRATLLANVDHVFARAAHAPIVAAMGTEVTAFCQFARAVESDEMKVELDATLHVRRIAKTLTDFAGAYIGLTFVPRARLADWRRAIAAVAGARGEAAVVEEVLQRLADDGIGVAAAGLDDIRWAEVDTPADLARAEALVAEGVL